MQCSKFGTYSITINNEIEFCWLLAGSSSGQMMKANLESLLPASPRKSRRGRASNSVSLPTDSHDGATVVNRNIEAGRGAKLPCTWHVAVSPMRGSQRKRAPAYQEMLHGRHWPMMPVKLQHGARSSKI
jgi:hypothetical protein